MRNTKQYHEFERALMHTKGLAFDIGILVEEEGDFCDASRARVLAGICEIASLMISSDDEDEKTQRLKSFLQRLKFALLRIVYSDPIYIDDAHLLRSLGFRVKIEDLTE